MTRRKGSKDATKRAPGAGGAMAGAGAPKGSGGGEREGAGAKAGTSNHMLPKTKAKKLVDEGLLLDRDGLYSEAFAKFQEAIEVDPENGHACLCASKLMWRLTYVTHGVISTADMKKCVSYAEESQRLGYKGGEAQAMWMLVMGPNGRGGILQEHIPPLLVYYKAVSEQELIKLLAGSAGVEARQVSALFLLYGLVLHEAGESDLAITANLKSTELDPENWMALGNLATALLIVGRLPEALQAIQAALRLRPAFEPHKRKLKQIQEMHLKETQVATLIIAGRLPEALEAVRAALRLWPTSELHKRKLIEIQEMQLKEIQVAAVAAAERAAFDEKVAAAAAALRAAYDDRYYPERAAFDDDVFQVAAAAAVERVADQVFPVIHQGPDGHPMMFLFHGQLGCVGEVVQGRETAVEDEDDEWTDCSEGEEYSSEDMGVDDDEETADCEGDENDEEQGDKEFPHEVMADEFD